MFSVTDIIQDPDFKTTFDIVHQSGNFNADGKWIPTLPESRETNIIGILLPAQMSDLQSLPEGERLKDTIKCYTNNPLSSGDQNNNGADLIYHLGKYYKVASLKYYEQVNVYMAIATLFQRRS